MKCNKCNINEADIFIGYLKPSRNKTLCICEECSITMGLSYGLLDDQSLFHMENHASDLSVDTNIKCPHCLTEIGHFLSTGQTGCPHCYLAFKKEIDEFFRINPDYLVKKSKLSNLSIELENAIDTENFEYAATLRDRIKVLSSGEVNEFVEN